MRLIKSIFQAVSATVLVVPFGFAQTPDTLVRYGFDAPSVLDPKDGKSTYTIVAKPTFTASGVDAKSLVMGSGLEARVEEGPASGLSTLHGKDAPSIYIRSRATPPTIEAAVTNHVYLSFKVTLPQAFTAAELGFDWAIGNGPNDEKERKVTIHVRSSLDDFANDVGKSSSQSVVGKADAPWQREALRVALDQVLPGRDIELRIYVTDDSSSSLVTRFDNITLIGSK